MINLEETKKKFEEKGSVLLMAYKKSRIMLNKYGEEDILVRAKEFERLGCKAIDILKQMSEIGIIYDSTIMSHLMKAIGWVIDVRGRSYQYNINEYNIDKSLLKSLDSVDNDKIKRNTELYFYNLVDKIYSLVHNNSNKFIKNSYIYIKEFPDTGKFEIAISANNLLFRPRIKIRDIINNSLKEKTFLDIIKTGTFHRDDVTYFILNAILGEIQKIINE